MSLRIEKVNSLIEHNLAEVMKKELSLKPNVFVSIAKVDTTPDLRYTRIFLSVYPVAEKDYVEATLKKELYRLQGALNKTLTMKILPRLQFVFEDKLERVDELEEVFDKIRKERGEKGE